MSCLEAAKQRNHGGMALFALPCICSIEPEMIIRVNVALIVASLIALGWLRP